MASAPSGTTNDGTNATITTPPRLPVSSRTSSGTLRVTSHSARADECEKNGGASETLMA